MQIRTVEQIPVLHGPRNKSGKRPGPDLLEAPGARRGGTSCTSRHPCGIPYARRLRACGSDCCSIGIASAGPVGLAPNLSTGHKARWHFVHLSTSVRRPLCPQASRPIRAPGAKPGGTSCIFRHPCGIRYARRLHACGSDCCSIRMASAMPAGFAPAARTRAPSPLHPPGPWAWRPRLRP